jgi:hypothetical protein
MVRFGEKDGAMLRLFICAILALFFPNFKSNIKKKHFNQG